MKHTIKRIAGLLVSLCLIVGMLPTTALADDTGMTFEDLQSALSNENGSGIYFRPSPTFEWPAAGGTLTFQQNLYLEGDWEIPENVTLAFPKSGCGIQFSGQIKDAPTLTINGSVKVTGTSNDQFIRRCNVVLGTGSSIQLETDYSSLHIDSGCTWTIEEGADLTPNVRLDGELTGEGTVSGQISVQGGFSGSASDAVISGGLTLTGSVVVGNTYAISDYYDTLTIPAGSEIKTAFEGYSAINVEKGSLVLDGTLDISGDAEGRRSGVGFAEEGRLVMGDGSELSLHYPYELTEQSTEGPSEPYVTGSGTIAHHASDVGDIEWYGVFGYDITGNYSTLEDTIGVLVEKNYIEDTVAIVCDWEAGSGDDGEEEDPGVEVTTNDGFLAAANDPNVTKIFVAGNITVDAGLDPSAALAVVETDKEIEIGTGVRFSIAEGTCLKVTSGEGMFHYSDLPVQGEENFDRLIEHGVFFLLRSTEDGDYYREFYGSENAATAALTSEEGWTVAVIPSGSIEIPADETLKVSVLYTGEEASIAKRVTTLDQLEAAAGIMGLSEIIVAGNITIDRYIIVPQTLTVDTENGGTLTIKNGEYDREAFEENYLDHYVPEDYLASPLHKRLVEDPSYEGNAGVDDRMVVYRIVDDADELTEAIDVGEGIYFAADMTIPAGVTEISTPVEIGTDVKLTLTGDLRMPPLYHRFGYQHIGRVDQKNFDQLAEDGIQFLIHVMGDNAERLLRPATLYAAGLDGNYWTTAILVGVEATMPEFGISNERTVVITEDAAVGGETGVIQVYGNLVLEEGVTLRTGWLTVHDGEIYLAEGADLDVAEDIDGAVTGPGADDDDDDDDHSGGGNPGGSSSSGSQTETERNPDGSTTTTVTRPNGTVTETTRYPDGSREVVETQTDGTVTTTTTDTSGNRTQVVERTDGSTVTDITLTDGTESTTTVSDSGRMETSVTVSRSAADAAEAEGGAAVLPMPSVPVTRDRDNAPTVTVDLPADVTGQVEIPVEDVTPGTVAVAVLPDGTEQVIRTTQTTEDGLVITVEGSVTVKIVDNAMDFSDVSDTFWAADAVAFVSARELFTGTSAETFSPQSATTRAQLMTVLARLDGADASGAGALEKGVAWAVENGISNGSDPGAAISRQQLVTMLYRYARSPAAEQELNYPDAGQVADYAADAMRWAVENGIITGTSDGTLDPYGPATRAQMAAIVMRCCALMG